MMAYRFLLGAVLLCTGAAFAATSTTTVSPAKAQYSADSKKAAAQYEADKKVCADEASSEARLQCRRDARSVYDKALAAAKATMTAATVPASAKKAGANVVCADCGTVVSVSMSERDGEGSAVGMIAGGVGGALLGNQIGGGIGKDIATVAGAVGGAYAGKKIEEKVRAHKVWTVAVQYPDNSTKNFEFKEDPGYKSGDAVKNAGASIVRR